MRQIFTFKSFLILFLALCILAPYIVVIDGFAEMRVEFFLTLIVFLPISTSIKDTTTHFFGWFLGIVLISLINSFLVMGIQFNWRDLMIVFQVICYWITYYSLSKAMRNVKDYDYLLNYFVFFTTLSALISFLQVNNTFSINDNFSKYYSQVEYVFLKYEGGLDFSHLDRVIGTVGDSRHFGMLLAMAVCVSLAMVRKSPFFVGICATICIIALFYTGSRTALVSVMSVFVIWIRFQRSGTLAMLVFSVPIIVFGYFILGTEIISEDMRVFQFQDDSYDVSVGARTRDNFEFFDLIMKQPGMVFFGMGPAKSVLPGSEHSEFGWFLIRFGLLGAIFYVRLLIKSIIVNYRGMISEKYEKDTNEVFYGLFGVMVIWLVYCFSESIFKNAQLMNFVLFFLAYSNRYSERINMAFKIK